MREIGSEFWDVPTTNWQNCIFSESTQWYLSGRSALQAIIKELVKVKSISLPSWSCDSMIKPFVDAGLNILFYPVYWSEGQLVQEVSFTCDALLLIDYFGYTGTVTDLNEYKGTVIRDVTHSLFSNTYFDADFYFGSLRKWCGVWTGGFAWTKNGEKLYTELTNDSEYVILREKAMKQKQEYIDGVRNDKKYLKVFDEAEEMLENSVILPGADRDVQMARKIDVGTIKTRRQNNAKVLRAAFSDWLIFPELLAGDVPMFVPVIVPDGKRNELRSYLIKHEIYCPIHWPASEYHKLDEKTEYLYQNELSLICDQRYTENDMNRIIETIRSFWKEI